MVEKASLKPTIWRSCRALAGETRLRMLQVLLNSPPLMVKEAAARLGIAPELATRGLRALQGRGLLKAERVSRYVYYTPAFDPSVLGTQAILGVMGVVLRKKDVDLARVMFTLTAFTHPRRLVILQELVSRPCTVQALREATGISCAALGRHLAKLIRRGFVEGNNGLYSLTVPDDRLSETLLHLTIQS